MTSTHTVGPRPTDARSYLKPALIGAFLLLAALAWFWFQPSAADEARLGLLEADPTLALPALDGEEVELLGSDTTVARRSWNGTWGITERTDRYVLDSRRVDRYTEDLFEHMDASAWEVLSVRCREDFLVVAGRQIIDGDWATLEFTAWATGSTGELSVRSAISATAGAELVMAGNAGDLMVDCDAM